MSRKELRTPSPTSVLSNENGFGAVIAILLFLVLIAGVIVALVMGLDRLYKDTAQESLFSNDAKLPQIMDSVRQKKDEIAGRLSELGEQKNPDSGGEGNTAVQKQNIQTVDERFDELKRSLRAGSSSSSGAAGN